MFLGLIICVLLDTRNSQGVGALGAAGLLVGLPARGASLQAPMPQGGGAQEVGVDTPPPGPGAGSVQGTGAGAGAGAGPSVGGAYALPHGMVLPLSPGPPYGSTPTVGTPAPQAGTVPGAQYGSPPPGGPQDTPSRRSGWLGFLWSRQQQQQQQRPPKRVRVNGLT